MSVRLETGALKRYRGLSTDEKPGRVANAIGDKLQTPPVGSVFTETDTGARYIWQGDWPWVRQEQTVEALLCELIETTQAVQTELQAIRRGQEEYVWENLAPPE